MTEANDRFAELTRRGHEVFTAAVQAWEQAARSLAEAARRPEGGLPDIRASVDAAFDFAARMLADQREFAKTVMSMGSQVVTATTQRAAPVTEPAAITASGDSPGTGAGASAVESSPSAVGADRQQDIGETAVVAVSPARDDSADTKAPDTKAPDTKAPDTKAPDTKAPDTKAPEAKAPEAKAPEARKTGAKKIPAARKTAAKKTAAPAAARATTAKKTAAPAAARATTAKKTAAPAAAADKTPPAENAPAAERTPATETPAPAKRSSPVEPAAGSGSGDRA
jgi:hypothetical protein